MRWFVGKCDREVGSLHFAPGGWFGTGLQCPSYRYNYIIEYLPSSSIRNYITGKDINTLKSNLIRKQWQLG
jgi:hypothetical protein